MEPKVCVRCGQVYQIDAQEWLDGSYSQLCDECLQAKCEANDYEIIPEKPVVENN